MLCLYSVCDEPEPVEGLRPMFLYTYEVNTDEARRSLQVVGLQSKIIICQKISYYISGS